MKYIIDGYNMVYKIEGLRGMELRGQRDSLLEILETAQASDQNLKNMAVVFDGQRGVSSPPCNSTVEVIFSKGGSADSKIVQIVQCSGHARDITVVSDDRELRSAVGRLGAKKASIDSFLKTITRSKGKRKQSVFKLNRQQADKINQELENIWLKQ